MKLGVLIQLQKDIDAEFKKVADLGFSSCQLCSWDESLRTDEMAEKVNEASQKYKVTISTFWCGWSGPMKWNFYGGPSTLGLVPEEYRSERVRQLKQGSDFARKINVENLATHAGFLPEVPDTKEYNDLIECLRDLACHIKENGQYFLFETGQETPVTLRRVIEDIGTGNLGINLDPANLILYGKANPVDAMYVFGDLVRDVHAKDGCYPTDGKHLGKETPIGGGMVNFPLLISKLTDVGYDGPLTIEREISGDEQIRDIKMAKEFLEGLI